MASTGLEALKASIERAKTKQSGGYNGKLNYFFWKEDDKQLVRFLSDDVINALFYEWVQTADGKSTRDFICAPDYFADHPTETNWRGEDWVLKYGGQTRDYNTKQLVAPKPREMTVGLAVIREEYSDGGKPAVRDLVEEIDVKGTKFKAKRYGVIKQLQSNFWSSLMVYYNRYGTICDRDYEITRTGGGKDTKYHFLALDPIPELDSEEKVQKAYGYGVKQKADDKNRFLYCPQTLREWADNYASEERAKFWILGDGKQAPVSRSSDDDVVANEPTPDTVDGDQTDEFDALRQSLRT